MDFIFLAGRSVEFMLLRGVTSSALRGCKYKRIWKERTRRARKKMRVRLLFRVFFLFRLMLSRLNFARLFNWFVVGSSYHFPPVLSEKVNYRVQVYCFIFLVLLPTATTCTV